MANFVLFPNWEDVASNYPYAPGRGDMSNEEWKAARKAARAKKKKDPTKQAEKALAQYEADWDSAMAENNRMIQDRGELPNRNIDKLKAGAREGFKNPFGWEAEEAAGQYISDAFERPQNLGEFGISWLGHTGEEAGKYLLSLLGFSGEKEKEATLNPYLEKYLAAQGGNGLGVGVSPALMGEPFPNLSVGINLKDIEAELKKIKKPEYKKTEYDKWDAIAEGLANMDWINMDMSKAVRAMNKWTEEKNKNAADVDNANEEARYSNEKYAVAQKLALEQLKAQNAMQNAQLAMARWQANQPRALGGNKMAWRDSAGNLHFEQIDKAGEARTVGNNSALIDIGDLDEKALKKMTPKKILQRANMAAMMYPDKDKIPFIQGYIMQATQMLPSKGD